MQPDPENMCIAFGISLLSCIRAEIYVISYVLPVNGHRAQTSDSIPTSLFVLPDPENIGITVGIVLLSRLKAEIYVISYLLPVLRRHIGYLVGVILVLTPPSCSAAMFRESH